jgi:hypothetical protein
MKARPVRLHPRGQGCDCIIDARTDAYIEMCVTHETEWQELHRRWNRDYNTRHQSTETPDGTAEDHPQPS